MATADPRSATTNVRVPLADRDLANRLAIDLTAGAGRRLSIADITGAALRTADKHRDDLLDELREEVS